MDVISTNLLNSEETKKVLNKRAQDNEKKSERSQVSHAERINISYHSQDQEQTNTNIHSQPQHQELLEQVPPE